MQHKFEIHASGLDVSGLERELEKNFRQRRYSRKELEFIKNVSFQPAPPAESGAFNPQLTAELFERPAALPVFSRMRLPHFFRPFARKLYGVLRLLYAKLGENKLQAFYNVVHEILAINHRLTNQSAQIEAIAKFLTGTQGQRRARKMVQLPLPPADIARLNHELIARLPPGKKALALQDDYLHFKRLLGQAGFRDISSSVSRPGPANLQGLQGEEPDGISSDVLLTSARDGSLDLVAALSLEKFDGDLDLLLSLAARKLKAGGVLVLRFSRGLNGSALVRKPVVSVSVKRLLAVTEEEFTIVSLLHPDSLRHGSFEMILARR